jgi:hypothetical protein
MDILIAPPMIKIRTAMANKDFGIATKSRKNRQYQYHDKTRKYHRHTLSGGFVNLTFPFRLCYTHLGREQFFDIAYFQTAFRAKANFI